MLPVVGFLAPRVSPELVLIIVVAPPAALLVLSKFEYGVLVIVLTAAFVRFSLPTGTQSRIVASLIVTVLFIALWVIRMLVVEKRLYLKPSRINVPLLAFMLVTIISYPWSNAFRDPLVVVWGSWPVVQLGGLGVMIPAETEESGNSRLWAWEHNWRVTGKHFLFGTGPAGYAAYYMSYFPTEALATHNNYIDIISQTGIVGLFFCLWFFGTLGWTGYKLCMHLKTTHDFSAGFAAATLAGWAGCVVSMALGDWLFPFVYTQTISGFDYAVYSWVLLGGMVALSNIYPTGEVTEVNGD